MGSELRENLVIGGISGRWPHSSNVHEYMTNLLEGVDMIGDVPLSWNAALNNLPNRMGRLGNLDKFDAGYFQAGKTEANSMDPRIRILLELTHEAIMDAGFNSNSLRGSKIGVFVGSSGEESRMFSKSSNKNPELPFGTSLSMLSNQISFRYDLHGPSLSVDTACSSSLVALNEAVINIKSGRCHAAVVATIQLNLDPDVSKRYNQLGMLSADGICKSFDSSANGYVRSEAAVVVFICKESFARRIYGNILNVQINSDGNKEQGMTFPSGIAQEQLLRQTIKGAGVDPKSIVYLEAHGTGTAAGDTQELNAIDRVFCTGRTDELPLLIGSVKSSLGHTEAASGLSSIIKVLLAAQYGTLPGNLHFHNPNSNIPGLSSGRLKVVDRNIPWEGGIVGVSSFGFGGANAHAILEVNIETNVTLAMELPLVIPFSATSADAINFVLSSVQDQNIIGLLHIIQNFDIPGHNFRGYCLSETSIVEIQERSLTDAPIQTWFVFSGMGSQTKRTGRDLMCFKEFRRSIEKSAELLTQCGIDLIGYISGKTNPGESLILYTTTCICAIQIALVDVLKSVEIIADGIFGHSFGEVACAYADGCYSAEGTILTAWALFKGMVDSNLPPGAMASLGVCLKENMSIIPKDILVACYNAVDNVSVAGTPSSIKSLIEELTSMGTFVRIIDSMGFAFHSEFMKPAEGTIKMSLENLNLERKTRSSKWISTSQTSDSKTVLSSDYFSNNVLTPVYFDAAVRKIPANSVVLEVAPNGIFQSILKRSITKPCVSISLTSRRACNNIHYFVSAIGKMFNSGLQPHMQKLYPTLKFPLRSRTLSLSPMIKWDQSESWKVPEPPVDNSGSIVEINLAESPHAFYNGHKINGQVLLPTSGYLLLMWRALAKNKETTMDQPVTFEKLEFKRGIFLNLNSSTKLTYSIHTSGSFEILENDKSVVLGNVRFEDSETFDMGGKFSKTGSILKKREFYNKFMQGGFEYSEIFQSLSEVDIHCQWAKSLWRENWVSFIECMLQLEYFANNFTSAIFYPSRIDKVSIDPHNFREKIKTTSSVKPSEVLILRNEKLQLVSCQGIEIQGIHFKRLEFPQNLDNEKIGMEPWSRFNSLITHKISQQNITAHCIVLNPDILDQTNYGSTKNLDASKKYCKSNVAFSGIRSSGEKIMGVLKYEDSTSQCGSVLTWLLPNSWSLADAAAVPSSYATAYYALIIRGNLKHKESIFIQCGDSAVGQAAIVIALSMNCRVFTTTSSKAETVNLLEKFPNLNSENIAKGNSYLNLEKVVLAGTKGLGVDVVINSLQGKYLKASLRLLAEYGRFIHLGNVNLNNNYSSIGMSIFLKSVSFHGVPCDILARCGDKDRLQLHYLIKEGIQFRVIIPLPTKVFKMAVLDEALEFLGSRNQTEQIVLEID